MNRVHSSDGTEIAYDQLGSAEGPTEKKQIPKRREKKNGINPGEATETPYDQGGGGPAVVLVCGGSVDRQSNAPLAAVLAEHFTVFNYDRRGRGDSEDTA